MSASRSTAPPTLRALPVIRPSPGNPRCCSCLRRLLSRTAGVRQRAAVSHRHLSLCDTRVSFLCVFHGLQRPFVLNNCIVVFVEGSAAGRSLASGVQGLRGRSPQPLGPAGAAARGQLHWGEGDGAGGGCCQPALSPCAGEQTLRGTPAHISSARAGPRGRPGWQRGQVRPDPLCTRGLTPPAFANRRGLSSEKCVSACELVSVFACVSNGCWVGHGSLSTPKLNKKTIFMAGNGMSWRGKARSLRWGWPGTGGCCGGVQPPEGHR